MQTQTITVQNKTSKGVLSSTEFLHMVQALALQAHNDYNTSPWVERGLSRPAIVLPLCQDEVPPSGAWNIILLDSSDQAGALGYHEDADGGKVPFSEVFVKTSREAGVQPSEVASHEMLEMLVDPYVEYPRTVKNGSTTYIVEVGDPVQGTGYDAGNGLLVANYVWPRWFGEDQTRPQYDQKGHCTEPWQLLPRGYISIKKPGKEWEQVFGTERKALPAWASRLPRIHA